MYALRLPFQGVPCAVYLSPRVLGYVRFAFALLGRTMHGVSFLQGVASLRSSCPGLCTLCVCPFRAYHARCIFPPGCRLTPFVLSWAMYALRLPFQGVPCAVYLSPRVSPHSVRLVLGYVCFAFAPSGRTMHGVSFLPGVASLRSSCPGLYTISVCPFRAYYARCIFSQGCRLTPFVLSWAMYA